MSLQDEIDRLNAGDCNSTRKFALELTTEDGKPWIYQRFIRSGVVVKPAFHDICRVDQAIAACEDARYPRSRGFEGRNRFVSFLLAALDEHAPDFGELARRFNIPERDRDEIIRTNQAAVITRNFPPGLTYDDVKNVYRAAHELRRKRGR